MFKLATLLGTAGVLLGANYHAGFKSAIPAPGSTVPSPATISVTFTEAIMAPPISTFQLLNSDSSVAQVITVTMKAGDKATIQGTVTKPLMPGKKYIVKWKNGAADDGHPLKGAFAFTVAAH
jgi:methionine-rich copper-binding protein CopC